MSEAARRGRPGPGSEIPQAQPGHGPLADGRPGGIGRVLGGFSPGVRRRLVAAEVAGGAGASGEGLGCRGRAAPRKLAMFGDVRPAEESR
jgi:hypothetical protein